MSLNSQIQEINDLAVEPNSSKSALIASLDKILIVLMVGILLTLSLPVALVAFQPSVSKHENRSASRSRMNIPQDKPTFQTNFKNSDSSATRIYLQ